MTLWDVPKPNLDEARAALGDALLGALVANEQTLKNNVKEARDTLIAIRDAGSLPANPTNAQVVNAVEQLIDATKQMAAITLHLGRLVLGNLEAVDDGPS